MSSLPLPPHSPSLLRILQNAVNILEFLHNSPPRHWKAVRLEELRTFHQAQDVRPQDQVNSIHFLGPLVPCVRFLDFPDTAVTVSGFLSSHTQLCAADILPQFLLWRLTSSSLGYLEYMGSVGVNYTGTCFSCFNFSPSP